MTHVPPTDHFRFAPDILRRLGEELIPHPEQGILELVRNAYDADATICVVRMRKRSGRVSDVVISDNGKGLDREAIIKGWLVLGRSSKTGQRRTARGRLTVGDKGLGRLAALRMGEEAHLVTRPASNPGKEFYLRLKWSDFDHAVVVEDVALTIEERKTDKPHGTEITISRMRIPITRTELQRLSRAMILLSDPFSGGGSFRPRLVARGFADLARQVRHAYFHRASFHLIATIDTSGQARAELRGSNGKRIALAKHPAIRRDGRSDSGKDRKPGASQGKTQPRSKTSPSSSPYEAPAARFELWEFPLDTRRFVASDVTVDDIRAWLASVGGVHVYHRGLRVYPYGDPGYDWLDLNLARARSPEQRPSTNNSIGRVVVPDEDERLLQKTDRTGFVENEAFQDLRQFAKDALDWMARERIRLRDERRKSERTRIPAKVVSARKRLDDAISTVPESDRAALRRAAQRMETARDDEARVLRKEVQLYRTLSTVGTTVAVFSHQTAKPVSQIKKMIDLIEVRSKAALDGLYESTLAQPIDIVHRSIDALKTFTALPLQLLKRDKREDSLVDVNEAILEAERWLKPFLDNAQIHLTTDLTSQAPQVYGSVAAVDAIVTNLITNTINAFRNQRTAVSTRELSIRTKMLVDKMELRVSDNGPGITHISLKDIWLPGETTTGGTGLGLTIVRDVVADLGGSVKARPHGPQGGAEFIVVLPTTRSTK